MKKIYLHIGAHKSASTMLQFFFANNSHGLKENCNLFYFGPVDVAASALGGHFRAISKRSFRHEDDFDVSLGNAKSSVRDLAERAGDSNLLISWEGFLGHSSLDVYRGIYTSMGDVARSINDAFSDFDIRVLFVVRRQDRFIESCYLQQIKERRAIEFQKFCALIDPARLSWLALADVLAKHLRSESLTVMPFELIEFLGHERFSGDALKGLLGHDIDLSGFAFEDGGRNQSISGVGVELALKMIPLLDDDEKKRKCAKYIFNEFSSARLGRPDLFGDFERRLLLACCAEDNRKLFSRYMPGYIDPKRVDLPSEVSDFWINADL